MYNAASAYVGQWQRRKKWLRRGVVGVALDGASLVQPTLLKGSTQTRVHFMIRYILNLLSYSAISLILLSSPAIAQGNIGDTAIGLRSSYANCTDHKDNEATPPIFKCTAAEYKYQDDRLNQIYKHLMTLLNKIGQNQFRQEQLAWLVMRKTYCNFGSTSSQVILLKSKNCEVYETAKRATEFEYFKRHVAKQSD
jgi:uncharacterized protein YecT (DUF1311 family)